MILEYEEDTKSIIIQSFNTYDINPKDSTCIKEVSVKIEQNKDTEDFIKSLSMFFIYIKYISIAIIKILSFID